MTEKDHSMLQIAAAKLRAKEPFVVARFPGQKDLNFYLNPSSKAESRSDSFLVKGWNKSDTTYYYASANAIEITTNQSDKSEPTQEIPAETSFERYTNHYNVFQQAFANKGIKKAILSRLKVIDIPADYDLISYFERLESAHPNALVYILLHPTEGLWIGATPEILISRKDTQYCTVSLAGTQPISEDQYKWGEKEKEEQEFVSAHIRQSLIDNGIESFSESEPTTAEAGSVAHLKSIFKFERNEEDFDFLNFARQLHPTPAISGTPVDDAINLINNTEDHNRQLYTGYLGRISTQSVDLFVNLRCMQVFPTKMVLYLGGGITKGSQLKAEWNETEQKAKTLMKQING